MVPCCCVSCIISKYYIHYPLVNIQKTMENHHFEWENQRFLWPCSIAIFVYQRVYPLYHTLPHWQFQKWPHLPTPEGSCALFGLQVCPFSGGKKTHVNSQFVLPPAMGSGRKWAMKWEKDRTYVWLLEGTYITKYPTVHYVHPVPAGLSPQCWFEENMSAGQQLFVNPCLAGLHPVNYIYIYNFIYVCIYNYIYMYNYVYMGVSWNGVPQ